MIHWTTLPETDDGVSTTPIASDATLFRHRPRCTTNRVAKSYRWAPLDAASSQDGGLLFLVPD